MDYQRAVSVIQNLGSRGAAEVSFVTPVLSVCLSAARITMGFDPLNVRFSDEATGYAENNGLRHRLGITSSSPSPGQASGRSYCQITQLAHLAEVDSCNAIIGSLLKTQLKDCVNQRLVNATCAVVGELHDNVASHSDGCGFSAAQVYMGNRKKIQLAVADGGKGLGGSVRRSGREMDDMSAIQWCLKKGNTTARTKDSNDLLGPQLMPGNDSEAARSANHHMGEGLFRLSELITNTGGSMWIWSGMAQLSYSQNCERPIDSDVKWSGTVYEIEIPISAFEQCPPATNEEEFADLARRLNL